MNFSKFIIVLDGSISFENKKFEREDVIGVETLISKSSGPLTQDMKKVNGGKIATIEIKEFLKIIGGDINKAIRSNQSSHETTFLALRKDHFSHTTVNYLKLLKLTDFILIKELG